MLTAHIFLSTLHRALRGSRLRCVFVKSPHLCTLIHLGCAMSMLQMSSVRCPPHQRIRGTGWHPQERTPPQGRRLADLPDHLPTQVMSARTPISSPSRISMSIRSSMCSDNLTVIPSSSEGIPCSEASSSSSKFSAVSSAPFFGFSKPQEIECDGHVGRLPSTRKPDANSDRESVASTFFFFQCQG